MYGSIKERLISWYIIIIGVEREVIVNVEKSWVYNWVLGDEGL